MYRLREKVWTHMRANPAAIFHHKRMLNVSIEAAICFGQSLAGGDRQAWVSFLSSVFPRVFTGNSINISALVWQTPQVLTSVTLLRGLIQGSSAGPSKLSPGVGLAGVLCLPILLGLASPWTHEKLPCIICPKTLEMQPISYAVVSQPVNPSPATTHCLKLKTVSAGHLLRPLARG